MATTQIPEIKPMKPGKDNCCSFEKTLNEKDKERRGRKDQEKKRKKYQYKQEFRQLAQVVHQKL
ncbi:unnamed protein product [Paramecium primaurelia]|uniref:Uncharacterized protein n=1 Tax=Paramecium primaurelia TaxID=5886 RepID=A0A8S1KT01_PARPR|nr:unnamed protein product [Paramecium primaurelia]